jgi:sugar/nucleoside kinase (ribokinase family)
MCVDLMVSGPDVTPRFGQVEKLVDNYVLEMGGSSCIFACQAAKLGLRVGVLGRVGDDDFGRLAVRRLRECGVDTQHITIDKEVATGLGIALCQGNDRAILTFQGSIAALSPQDVSGEILISACHLHHGSFYLQTGLRPAMPEILRRAKSLGLSTSLDPNWDPQECWDSGFADCLPFTDILMLNEQEALRISCRSNMADAVSWLRNHGVKLVTLKRGIQGAGVYSHEAPLEAQVSPANGGDSVGAGDSFDAGFLAGWLRELTNQQSLQIACLCGKAAASQVGGIAGQPTWRQIIESISGYQGKIN